MALKLDRAKPIFQPEESAMLLGFSIVIIVIITVSGIPVRDDPKSRQHPIY